MSKKNITSIGIVVAVSFLCFLISVFSNRVFEKQVSVFIQNHVCKCCGIYIYKIISSENQKYDLIVELAHSSKDGSLHIFARLENNEGNSESKYIFWHNDDNLKATWANGELKISKEILCYWIDDNIVYINGITLSVDDIYDYRKSINR